MQGPHNAVFLFNGSSDSAKSMYVSSLLSSAHVTTKSLLIIDLACALLASEHSNAMGRNQLTFMVK